MWGLGDPQNFLQLSSETRVAEHGCFSPPLKKKKKNLKSLMPSLLSSTQSWVGPASGEKRGRRSHNLLPASPDRRPARAERQLGRMESRDEPGRAQHAGPVPTSPYAASPRGDRLPRAAGAKRPGPWTQPRTHAKHALQLAVPQPLCEAAQHPLLAGPFPRAVGYQRLGSNRPPAELAPAGPRGPSPAPPPTCCRRGCFHLHLPLTPRPAPAKAPHGPASDPPPPAHGPTAPRGSAPDPQ